MTDEELLNIQAGSSEARKLGPQDRYRRRVLQLEQQEKDNNLRYKQAQELIMILTVGFIVIALLAVLAIPLSYYLAS